jgi:hypothetical protein
MLKRLTILLASAAILAAACNTDSSTGVSSPAPTVTSTDPANLATGVGTTAPITATFSEAMDEVTVNPITFTLKQGNLRIPSAVSIAGGHATLTPATRLDSNVTYTAAITNSVTSLGGVRMAVTKTWTFTTVAAGTAPAPTVTTTAPASAASGVPRNASVTATFSTAMAPGTINGTTFTLTDGANTVPATVTHSGTTATLDPTNSLAANTAYTAAISTAATNTTGQPLAAIKTWTFTTVATSVSGPAAVNLGTAGNYVILAKSGVSTTGAGSVVGDIGISPAAATFVTGFALTADATNTFATSAMVTGKVWASDYSPPTPTILTTAILDMQTAYTDAAGRVLPDFTELGAGNIQGLTLVPGLYKWGTGVDIPSAVTLSGGANDVWIFQIAQDLTVGNGAIVTLTGGAQAKNVFWQVAGQAILGTTSQFQGNILSQTLISFNTGATITGRALAQTAVTLNATAVTHP